MDPVAVFSPAGQSSGSIFRLVLMHVISRGGYGYLMIFVIICVCVRMLIPRQGTETKLQRMTLVRDPQTSTWKATSALNIFEASKTCRKPPYSVLTCSHHGAFCNKGTASCSSASSTDNKNGSTDIRGNPSELSVDPTAQTAKSSLPTSIFVSECTQKKKWASV